MNNLMKKALQRRGPAPDFPSAAPPGKATIQNASLARGAMAAFIMPPP